MAVAVVAVGASLAEGSPAWATFPGGNGLIAFTRTTAAGSSIAVVDPDRSGFRTLIENAAQPAWSADGQSIAFVRKSVQGDSDIFIANADGSGARELVIPGHDETEPTWSPDGKQLAFVEYTQRGRILPNGDIISPLDQINVINIDGSGRRQVTHDDHYYGESPDAPDWSPDGQWILFNDMQGEPALIHPDGTGQVDLGGDGTVARASFSPDGKQIVDTDTGSMCVTSLDGKHGRCQVVNGIEPVWSPDGREIVFARLHITRPKTDTARKVEDEDLYIMNADGSGIRPLVRGKASTFAPAWQPATTDP
jgi:Tol biopolymer transport system component